MSLSSPFPRDIDWSQETTELCGLIGRFKFSRIQMFMIIFVVFMYLRFFYLGLLIILSLTAGFCGRTYFYLSILFVKSVFRENEKM